MINDVREAMCAVESLPPLARKMSVENIMKNVTKLLALRSDLLKADKSIERKGGLEMDKVFSNIRAEYGI